MRKRESKQNHIKKINEWYGSEGSNELLGKCVVKIEGNGALSDEITKHIQSLLSKFQGDITLYQNDDLVDL